MKKILSAILCSVLIFTLAACGKFEVKKDSNSKDIVKEEPKELKDDQIKSREVLLYFSDDQAMYLVGEKRDIEKPTAKNIVEELVKGPKEQSETIGKLHATLPNDLEILDVQIKEGIAYVDFKANVTEKISGGSAGEGMALYSIINTLVLDEELGVTKVQFLLEGQTVETIKGHYNVNEPMSADKDIIRK